jgi:hypothetical protein
MSLKAKEVLKSRANLTYICGIVQGINYDIEDCGLRIITSSDYAKPLGIEKKELTAADIGRLNRDHA